jgi:hypothetical protein
MENDPRRIPRAISLWGEGVVNAERAVEELNFGMWGWNRLSVEFRKFLFNLFQGRLYLNNVLARMDPTKSSKCTFCHISAVQDLHRRNILEGMPEYNYYLNLQSQESVHHLFWDCEHSQNFIQKSYRWVRGFDWYRGVETIEKNSFFLGIQNINKGVVYADLLWKHFVKFHIYWSRLCHKLPTFPSFKFEFESMLQKNGMNFIIRQLGQLELIYT